ncbi:hypothetical protein BDP27DRAFT_1421120 [Rhodocollybia butyracea]|uniref:F-box domain-containing protein n=1 Tax=Rhodocollybia butyracea TaxID=206335 RepID=A0A9P5U803_9AGAR|nr:hypothetical protein BDP27DRAFT_1421120 [Rhodocollybia butyracea]
MAQSEEEFTIDNTSGYQDDKSPGENTLGDEPYQEKPSRKRDRTGQKSGSSKPNARNVDNCPDIHCEIESIQKFNFKKRMPEEFRRVKGKRGLLEWLAKDIPFDVILEIFCCVEPGDLLRLSRTSKDIRTILMSRRYEYIWRSARQNVDGLPPLPNDLTNLSMLICCLMHIAISVSVKAVKIYSGHSVLGNSFLDNIEEYLSRQPVAYRNLGILPSEYVQVGQERVLVGSNKYAKKFETEFRLLRTELEREEWILQKQKELEAIQEWRRSTLSNRSKELDALRTERKQDIIARLSSLGWGEEVKLMDKEYESEFSAHRLVKQAKQLTDHDWERMKSELLHLLSRHKNDRRHKERSGIIGRLYVCAATTYVRIRDTLDPRQPLPAIGDVLTHPPLTQRISYDYYEIPPSLDNISSKVSKYLPDIIAKWRPEKTQELVNLLETSGTAVCNPQVAASVFECKGRGCGKVLLYPWGRWTSKSIGFSSKASRVSKKVVEGCGLDPATATVQDLYDANPLIECTTCTRADGSRYFTWWPLILSHPSSHSIKVHPPSSAALKLQIASEFPSYDESLSCSHCHSTISKRSMRSHLETNHGINLAKSQSPLVLDLQAIQEHWYLPLIREPSVCLFRPGHYKVEDSWLA